MAVNYKYADLDLDLEDYIANLNSNLNSYVQDRVKRYGWNDGQVQEFRNSFDRYMQVLKDQLANNTGRLSTDVHGYIHDSLGELNDTDNDDFFYNDKGEQLSREDFNKLKQRKQKNYSAFESNRQFANYAHQVLDGIVKYNKDQEAKKKASTATYDDTKHGFGYWWGNVYNADGGNNLQPYIELDAVDSTTGKRARTNRATRAAEFVKGYADWLKNQNINYDGSPLNGDERQARLAKLAEQWGNGTWDNDDLITASQAGINQDWLNKFFTEDEAYKTPEEQQAAKQRAEAAEKEAADKEWLDAWKVRVDNADKRYQANRGEYWGDNKFELGNYKIYNSDEELGRDFDDLGKDANGNPDYEAYLNDWIQNPFDKQKGVRAISLLIHRGIAKPLENGNYYIRQKDDLERGRALMYNPTTGELYYDFVLNVPEHLKAYQDKFKMDRNPDYKYDIYAAPSRKQGGTIEKLQLGGIGNLNQDIAGSRMKGFEERGKARGNGLLKSQRTAKQQEAGERLINSKNENAQDLNSGFTAIEVGRAATILGDLTSMGLAFAPGVGSLASAAVGAASTTGNLALDLADDSVTGWEAAKNAAFGYGMDLMGAIPVFGATSKMAKIAKTAAKLANKVMPFLLASQVTHAGEYYESWKKLLSTDGKVSVDDWKNIAASLQLVAGGAAGLKRKSTFKKNEAKAVDNDKIAMDFVDKNGTKQTKLFMGEDAKAIREAQKSGKIEDLKKVTTDKFDDLQGLEINMQGSREGWKIPFTKKSIGAKTGRADIFNVKNTVNDKGVVDTSNPFIEKKWNTPDVSAKDLKPVSNAANDALIIADLRSKVEKNKARMPQLKKRVDKAKTEFEASKTAEPKNVDQNSQEYKDWKASNLEKRNILKQTKHLRDMNLYDLSRLRKGYRNNITPEGNAQFTLPTGQIVTRNWKDILAKSGIVFKKGGKFQAGGSFNDVRHKLSWFDNMFNTDIKGYLSGQQFATDADRDAFIKNFNDRQQTWFNNKQKNVALGWSPKGGKVFKTPEVADYQDIWNSLGLNKGIKAFNDTHPDLHNTPQGLGDTEANNWKDGAFGLQTFIRHGGTADDWKGKENELKDFQNQLALLGLTYTEGANGMYELGKLSDITPKNVSDPGIIPSNTSTVVDNLQDKSPAFENVRNFLRNLTKGDLTNMYGGPRVLGALLNNDKVTRMANNMARIVDLKDPFTFNRYVMSDLGAEQQGKDAAGLLYSKSSKPLTSDANALIAAQFESANKGLEFINQGLRQSDAVARQSREQAWAQDKENAANIHQTAMDNRKELNSAARQISINNQLKEKQKFDIFNQFAQQKEFEAKEDLQNKKDIMDRLAMQDIADATHNNLKHFVPDIPDDELQAWELHAAGKEVPDNLKDALSRAYQKAMQAKNQAIREYYGVPQNNWSNIRKIATPTYTPWSFISHKVSTNKKGGTLEEKKELAKLRGRIKDYEIFHKNINKDKDRHEKALDRIAKYKK